ncbi:MAG: prolipoprotein diacylglyceryl transferase [Candidatus Eisenbacteria bacterium]|nr:prolipoprotein diacylglyceryl transferase [Candidatus Latescibacterota bacterium]MBD3302615.1 prolipoprotein diacylglyceryl transferase [Candidatus Eisenbacteria bacterium]
MVVRTLFEVGPFRVHIYGVLLAVAFVVGSLWATRAARRRGIPEERILSLIGWILISSIIGARLHFVLAHPSSYEDPLQLFRIWEGGLTLYGGLIAAILVSFFYLRRHRIGFRPVADAIAPALALGEGIARIGCFLNGCCFGRACEAAIGVHYPPDSYAEMALGDTAVYPSQLFLSVGMIALFVLLWRIERHLPTAGRLFGLYLLGQGTLRYAVDFSRYYEPVDRLHLLGGAIQTESQLVALVLAILGLLLLLRTRERARGEPEGRRT